jgi:hypothetical protein
VQIGEVVFRAGRAIRPARVVHKRDGIIVYCRPIAARMASSGLTV